MLQKMRAFSKSIFASIFLGVVALSFVVWGIADVFRTRSDTDVATVGSTVVSYETFSRDYQNFLRSEGQRIGQTITPDLARKMNLGNVTLESVINRTALDNISEKLGLIVSDADVTARIRAMPAFNGPLGAFDKDTFDRLLARNNFNEQDFVEGIRGDMTRDQLIGPVEQGTQIPIGYAHALFAFSTELRSTEYMVLTPQAVGTIPPPGDAVLAAYVKAHTGRFSTPEYRAVTVAVAGPEDVAADIKITDAQIQSQYDANKSVYVIPEKRDVEQITFPDEASANAARTKISGGATFQAAAFATKKTVDSRGSVSQDDLGTNGAAVFALPADGVSAPLKNFSSWVLMHVTKITPGKTTTFEQAKPELVKGLTDRLAANKIIDMANAYSEAAGSGAEIADAANKSGMRLVHIPAIDAHGLAPDGSKVALPDDPELLAQIFTAEVGESGDPFPTKTGRTYVISVEGVTPPKVKSLSAVHDEAVRDWTAEQTTELLKKRAAELAAQARAKNDIRELAKGLGSPVLFGPAITRDKTDDTFSAPLVKEIFSVPPGGIAYGPMVKGGNYIVARVTGVLHPPLPPTSPGFRQGIRELSGQVAEDIVLSLAKAARDTHGVTINKAMVDRITGSDNGS